MKKLMILGAGIYQVPLILQAKKQGIYTIAVSIPGEYPGFGLADKVYEVDTRDYLEVAKIARSEKINGICTSGTDVAVVSIGYVCDQMGLKGISYKAARQVTDKALMKEAFFRKDVRTAPYRKVRSLRQAQSAVDEFGFPVVVKTVDSSGSRGITIVKRQEELEKAYLDGMKVSQKYYLLVEKFLTGEEIGVDAFVQKGKVTFMMPHTKFLYHTDRAAMPVGHGFPYPCSKAVEREIMEQIQKAVDATGMDNCPVNADVIMRDGKAWVLEVGGRTGATCIPELISIHCGFNFYNKMIRHAIGEKVAFTQLLQVPCMGKLLFSKEAGVITGFEEKGLKKLRDQGIKVQMDYPVGHKVEAMENGTNRIGHVIAKVDTEEKLDEMISQVRQCIRINDSTLEEIWRR